MIIIVILLLIFLVAEGVYQLYRKNVKNLVEQKLMSLVMTGKFKEFDEYVETREVKRALPPFNIEYIKMNAAIMANNGKKFEKSLENLTSKKLNDKQKREVYLNGFNYYIDKNDKKNSQKYKNLLLNISGIDSDLVKYVNRLYDIKVEKKSDCLNELLSELESNEVKNKASHYLLVAEIYKNLNDDSNYKKYIELYQEIMNITK